MKFDVIIIGGGRGDAAAGLEVLSRGLTCALICPGRISGDSAREQFRLAGGVLLLSDFVKEIRWTSDGRVEGVYTQNLGSTLLEADKFILCSGRFFSRGLVSDRNGVYEPVFALDVRYEKDRSLWCSPDFFAAQPFEKFGVETLDGKALKGGKSIENLYVIGEILGDE